MRRIIREENERGATVFFSSHILEQVEAICDRVAILNRGRLVAVDSIEGLRDSTESGTELAITVDAVPEGGIAAVEAVEGIQSVTVAGDVVTVRTTDGSKTAILHALEDRGAEIRDFRTEETSLEELFARYTEEADAPLAPNGGESA
jgi:ABC-2 type transport system ATP-binding protein